MIQIVISLLMTMCIDEVYSVCGGVTISGICFHDVGNGHYKEEKLVTMDKIREVSIRLTTGQIFSLSANPALFGYFFEQHNITTKEVIMASPVELCQVPDNGNQFTGKIIIVWRGGCTFEEKSSIAALYGAAGLIILNTRNSEPDLLSPNVCIPSELITPTWFAAVLIEDVAQSNFIQSNVDNIVNASISRNGKGIGQTCGGLYPSSSAISPMCAGFHTSSTCKTGNICGCNGPDFILTTVNGVNECEIAVGANPQSSYRDTSSCNGYVYPGGSGCSVGNRLCVGFPVVICQSDICQCASGYEITGKPGTSNAQCIPMYATTTDDSITTASSPYYKSTSLAVSIGSTSLLKSTKGQTTTETVTTLPNVVTSGNACNTAVFSESDICMNLQLFGSSQGHLSNNDKKMLQKCLLDCYDVTNCCGFHFQLTSGHCITYQVADYVQNLDIVHGWLFYSGT